MAVNAVLDARKFAEAVSRRLYGVEAPAQPDAATSKALALTYRLAGVAEAVNRVLGYLHCLAGECLSAGDSVICRAPFKWYISSWGQGFTATRMKYGMFVSYTAGNGGPRLVVGDRQYKIIFEADRVRICRGDYCLDVDPVNLEEVKSKYSDIKYLLRTAEGVVRKIHERFEEHVRINRIECEGL